jgi:plastocyanin
MRRSLALAALLLLAACSNKTDKPAGTGAGAKAVPEKPAPTGSGVLKGVVKLTGNVPPPEPWPGAGNADCKSLHDETVQLVKVKDGAVQDVFVYVKEGLPKGSYPAPSEPVVFDQKGCEFSPRVFGVRAGQPIAMGNSDKLMHNVKSPEFNQGFPFGVKRTMTLNEPAVMAIIKCDVHPWMRSYAGVMEHPYFAVTGEDGTFEIKGLVDGEVTVEAWHEKLGKQEQKVTVAAAAPATVELTFKGK